MPNSSKAKTNLACHLCDAVLGSAENRLRHKKTVLNLHAPIAPVRVKCDDCLEEFSSVAETIQHIEIDHGKSANKQLQNSVYELGKISELTLLQPVVVVVVEVVAMRLTPSKAHQQREYLKALGQF